MMQFLDKICLSPNKFNNVKIASFRVKGSYILIFLFVTLKNTFLCGDTSFNIFCAKSVTDLRCREKEDTSKNYNRGTMMSKVAHIERRDQMSDFEDI